MASHQQTISPQRDALMEMRKKHGFTVSTGFKRTAGRWSRQLLGSAEQLAERGVPAQLAEGASVAYLEQKNAKRAAAGLPAWTWVPKNAPILDWLAARFAFAGFAWEPKITLHKVKSGETKERHSVAFTNYPTVGRSAPTIADLILISDDELVMFDGFREMRVLGMDMSDVGKPVSGFSDVRARMDATGIAYKGLDGVSWRPGVKPLELSKSLEILLTELGVAVFLLYDAVRLLYKRQVPTITDLLRYKVPDHIPRIMCDGTVDVIRPDIVLLPDSNVDGGLRPVVTELESCPAGHGMLHAMQVGYNQTFDMVDAFVRYLAGRPYIVLATNEWSEYLFEQAAFVRALRERGVDARIFADRPLQVIHDAVQPRKDGERKTGWHAPPGIEAGLVWNTNLMERLREKGFLEFIHGFNPHELPASVGKAVVFRFGYFDNFSREVMERMRSWQAEGAVVINAIQYTNESKVLMAARRDPHVRQWIRDRNERALAVLDMCLAETRLVKDGTDDFEEIMRDRGFWLVKYAGWDGDNMSWGARSLQVGAQLSSEQWPNVVRQYADRPHPTVAQHVINSAQFTTAYVDPSGAARILTHARSRLTPFLLRGESGGAVHAGSMITLRAGSFRIHGASDSVEMPVEFK